MATPGFPAVARHYEAPLGYELGVNSANIHRISRIRSSYAKFAGLRCFIEYQLQYTRVVNTRIRSCKLFARQVNY